MIERLTSYEVTALAGIGILLFISVVAVSTFVAVLYIFRDRGMNWIMIDEIVPPDGAKIIVKLESGEITGATYASDDCDFILGGFSPIGVANVTSIRAKLNVHLNSPVISWKPVSYIE